MTSVLRDVRYGLRCWWHRPAFFITTLATIAVAIAANTLIFALVRHVLLSPLPLPDPNQLVLIEETYPTGRTSVTGATFIDLSVRSRSLKATGAFRLMPAAVSTVGQAAQATAATVSRGYFDVLGLAPSRGRLFAAADFLPGASPIVLLSDELWQRLFDRDPAVIGRIILINATPRQIVGVVEMARSIPGSAEAWLPYSDDLPLFQNRRAHLFTVVGRLRNGGSAESASSELDAIARQIRRESPAVGQDFSIHATRLQDRLVEPIRTTLLVLWAAVSVLLLVALSNVANLLLAEASVRARDLSVRTALGATRGHQVATLAIEAALLGAIGGIVGAASGGWGVVLLRGTFAASLPRGGDIAVDPWVFAFGTIASIVCTVLFGIAPALRASRRDPAEIMRSRHGDAGSSRLRDLFVALQVALTIVLLVGAGLLGRSLLLVSAVPLGFDPSHVVTIDLSLPAARYPDAAAHRQFYARVLEDLRSLRIGSSVGVTGALPFSPTAATTMVPEHGRDDQQWSADVIPVSQEFLSALRIPLRRGRAFDDRDRAGSVPVALVNETAARTFWPAGVDPVRRSITMRDWGEPYTATVVGIVGDVRQLSPEQAPSPAVFFPFEQFPETTLTQSIVVRTDRPLDQTVASIRDLVRRVDRDQPITLIATLDDRLSGTIAGRRVNLVLLGAFAAAALLLAAVGIYGVVTAAVGARTREIGVRVALGATPRQVAMRTALSAGLPVAGGAAIGLGCALLSSRALQTLIFGITPHDAPTLCAAVVLVVTTAVLAVSGPARRAVRVDPIVALRAE